jgi:DNA-binding response OmpR family regulator
MEERVHTLLVADDDENVCELIKLVFTNEGFKVYVAKDGASALDKIEKYKPEVVILDVMMPNLDGYTISYLSKKIKGYNPRVIILTVRNTEFDAAIAERMHADAFFTKPVNIDRLVKKVKSLISE